MALTPLVLKLAACSSGDGGDDPAADDAPEAGGGAPAPGGVDTGTPVEAAPPGETTEEPSDDEPAASSGAVEAGDVLLGLYPGDGVAAMAAAAARLDFSWLGEGDTVLIKVASNSGNPHPATTSPAGVKGMVDALVERGAGRVIVADQAGVEWVRLSAQGRFSSTRERFMTNGLIELEGYNGAELHFFDDQGFDDGYFEATLPADNHWPRGLWLPNIVKEVDHILYMPRIGAHTLAGLTLAQKSAIGWLRDDSRHDLHNEASQFYEKYAEISRASELADKTRLAVTVAEQVLLHGGPDEGAEYHADPPLVVASTSLANHDAVAASILVTLQNTAGVAPAGMLYSAATASLFNTFFAGGAGVATGDAGPWVSGSTSSGYTAHTFEQSVMGERAVVHGWALDGGQPASIPLRLDGEAPSADLMSGLESHGAGIYRIG